MSVDGPSCDATLALGEPKKEVMSLTDQAENF